MKYRIEKDSIGEIQISAESYYGIQTLRGHNNLEITKRSIPRQMIKALAIVKKAAAKANIDAENISVDVGNAIMLACDEILNGKNHGQFITDLIQGGAGTSMNMNANEIIANRANEELGGSKGTYEFVHPIDHVNRSQSTNDVIPTAGKIAVIKQIKKLLVELKKLRDTFEVKAAEFKDVVKIGRTHLQEAVPMTIGQEFEANANILQRDIRRLDDCIDDLSEVNMGATVIGTGLNANSKYTKKIILYLNKYSGEKLTGAKNLIDSTRSLDAFVWASSALKVLATDLSKIASDIRLMASPALDEITIPVLQEGSTSNPAKYNPVIPEIVNQVAFYVMGLDTTISKANEAGQLELNPYLPIVLMCMFEEITNLRHAIRAFNEHCIAGLNVNIDKCAADVKKSLTTATALIPHLGFDTANEVIKEAKESGKTIKEVILNRKLLSEKDVDLILDIETMTKPGISGEELIIKK